MADFVRKKYGGIPQGDEEKFIDAALKLVFAIDEDTNNDAMLHDAGRIIHRVFGFNEVTIGLRSPEDGKFRYEAIIGHTREAEKALRSFSYTREEMCDCKEYPGVPISKYTEFNIREYETYKIGVEEKAFNRPLALRDTRPSPETMIEGDYIDVYIYASKDDMIGWIELSNPRYGKFPSRHDIRWLELFAATIGLGIIKNQAIARRRKYMNLIRKSQFLLLIFDKTMHIIPYAFHVRCG